MSSKYSRRAPLWVAAHARAGAVERRLSCVPDGFDFNVIAGEAHAHCDVIRPSSVTAGDESLEAPAGSGDVCAALATVAE